MVRLGPDSLPAETWAHEVSKDKVSNAKIRKVNLSIHHKYLADLIKNQSFDLFILHHSITLSIIQSNSLC